MSRPLGGYPAAMGNVWGSVFPHTGPASYTQFTDTPAAGGDTVEGVEAGMKYFDFLVGGITDSGTYFVRAVPPAGHPSTSQQGAPSQTWTLVWYVLATGAEAAAAADLDAEIVRLFGLGPVA